MPDVSTTFTWNYIAERVSFDELVYVARVALAKSRQRFVGHVNVAPFRARSLMISDALLLSLDKARRLTSSIQLLGNIASIRIQWTAPRFCIFSIPRCFKK